uniref:transmembrane protein 176A n=1 Tax=Euleptes europaea TaxID=460621 RepID=UPI0025424DF1|nr:transmembrane protein 176A [Euleptes europaea]
MATSVVKVNGTEVSMEDSGKTVVNINITQESWLSYLAKAVAAAGQKWPRQKGSAPETAGTPPARARCTGEQKVLGGVQILLGVVCLGLGGVLCMLQQYNPPMRSGGPFWMGSLFVLSGSFSVLSERRGGCTWVLLATFFNLASVVAGCAGLIVGVANVMYLGYTPYWVDEACKGQDYYGSWQATQSPTDNWRVNRCKSMMTNLLHIFSGVQILLVIFSVAAMAIALFCFGYGLRVLCCSPRANSEEYTAIGDPEVPPPYEEPAEEKTAA